MSQAPTATIRARGCSHPFGWVQSVAFLSPAASSSTARPQYANYDNHRPAAEIPIRVRKHNKCKKIAHRGSVFSSAGDNERAYNRFLLGCLLPCAAANDGTRLLPFGQIVRVGCKVPPTSPRKRRLQSATFVSHRRHRLTQICVTIPPLTGAGRESPRLRLRGCWIGVYEFGEN